LADEKQNNAPTFHYSAFNFLTFPDDRSRQRMPGAIPFLLFCYCGLFDPLKNSFRGHKPVFLRARLPLSGDFPA